MTTVAVTGATGFLGRAFVRTMLDGGHSVVAITRPDTDVTRLPQHDRLTSLAAGNSDVQLIAALCEHAPSAFVHLAWGGVSADRRQDDDQGVNIEATRRSVELAAATGCSYWLGAGSQAEYGPRDVATSETDVLRPVTAYGSAKVAAHAAATAAASTADIAVGWARVYSVYGPHDRERAVLPFVIGSLLQGVSPELGPCTHQWDFLHVDDAAAALAAMVDHRVAGPTNVASGTARTLSDAIELATRACDAAVAPTFDATRPQSSPLIADVTKLTSLTGWTPHVPLADGIASLVDHVRATRTPDTIGVAT